MTKICPTWKNVNLYESTEKLDFNLIYSNALVDIRRVSNTIEKVWNTTTANGSMHM